MAVLKGHSIEAPPVSDVGADLVQVCSCGASEVPAQLGRLRDRGCGLTVGGAPAELPETG